MNSQIFNMEANAQRLLKEKTYLGNGHCRFEQLGLIKYLLDKGKTKEEIFELWRSTDLYVTRRKCTLDQTQEYFNELYKASEGFRMQVGNRFKIYQSEIDWINAMETYRWVKEYLLALLCVYKFYGQEWCLYDKRVKRFCYSATSIQREVNHRVTQRLCEALQRYKPYELRATQNGALMKFGEQDKSELCYDLLDPRQVEMLMGFITTEVSCVKCNGVFMINSFSKNKELCKACYDDIAKVFNKRDRKKYEDANKTQKNRREVKRRSRRRKESGKKRGRSPL